MLLEFCPAVLEYCSAVWCSVADTYLKLLDRVVSGASFLTEGVFEYDLAHRRSVVVLCMMYNYGAQPVPYVLVHVTCGALISHWFTSQLKITGVAYASRRRPWTIP